MISRIERCKRRNKNRSKKLGEQSVFRQMILAIIVQNVLLQEIDIPSYIVPRWSTKQNERLNLKWYFASALL
jgi:hypothetical protein